MATPTPRPAATASRPSARLTKPVKDAGTLFTRENLKWMIIGGVLIVLGFILMSGGKSQDPTQFNPSEVYSPIRITIAPILILAGLAVEVFAIMKKPKQETTA